MMDIKAWSEKILEAVLSTELFRTERIARMDNLEAMSRVNDAYRQDERNFIATEIKAVINEERERCIEIGRKAIASANIRDDSLGFQRDRIIAKFIEEIESPS